MIMLRKIATLLIAAFILIGCEENGMTEPEIEDPADMPDAPQVTLLSPSAGETLVDTITIKWDAADPDIGETELLQIDLDYSNDAGGSWISIDANLANNGAYFWIISGLPDGIEYLVRVTAADTTGLSDSDSTDSAFFIIRPIYITDFTRKDWEISHAVWFYNMAPENWGHGLGPYAIEPINLPEMLSQGDKGYPADDSEERVIGVSLNGDVRAYAIDQLRFFEVANDIIGGVPAAVVY